MGLNLDLVMMLNAPAVVKCPRCKHEFNSYFDDYDVECGHPNTTPGVWSLRCYCQNCEHEFTVEAIVKFKVKK